jgi:hypothetical protein
MKFKIDTTTDQIQSTAGVALAGKIANLLEIDWKNLG